MLAGSCFGAKNKTPMVGSERCGDTEKAYIGIVTGIPTGAVMKTATAGYLIGCLLFTACSSVILGLLAWQLQARLSETNEKVASLSLQLQSLTADYGQMNQELFAMRLNLEHLVNLEKLEDMTNSSREMPELSSLHEPILAYDGLWDDDNATDSFVSDVVDSDAIEEEHRNRVKRSNRRGKQSGVKSSTKTGKRHHKKAKMLGPVATHFKGGLPETLIRDGGLVAPWYPDKSATGDFGLLTYEFREGMGAVEVTEPGLYLIYAQAYYLTSESLNSFTINVMPKAEADTPIAYCSTSLSLARPGSVTEASCFTSIVRFLNTTTRVTLKQRERNRRMILRDGYTFLGLVKLNSQQPGKPRRGN